MEHPITAAPATGSGAGRGPALLTVGFRPFFLVAGGFAVLQMLAWLAVLEGWVVGPGWLPGPLWHAHEMVFGWAAAAVAGFLLTSVPVWTRTAPVAGVPLALLVGLWLAGRLGVALGGALGPGPVALLDLGFLPAVCIAITPPLLRAGQRRNQGFPLIVAAFAAANGLVHLEALGLARGLASLGLRGGVDLLVLLVVVVGGRLTPAFTANALRRRGEEPALASRPWLEHLAAPAILALLVVDLALPRTLLSGAAALGAAVVVLGRLSGWRSARTLADPLLWSLHLGYAWVGVGLTALAISDLAGLLPYPAALHALTAGALGAMILAVMSRVPLGHTGRPFVAPAGMGWAYALLSLGAAVRAFGPVLTPALAPQATLVGGLLWAAAFAIFLALYTGILLGPRLAPGPD